MENSEMLPVEKTVLDWIRDAHAMEQQSKKIFEDLNDRLENYPQFQQRIQDYLAFSLDQQEKMEFALERHGGSASILKDVVAKVVAFTQSVSSMPMGDEVVKAILSAYTFIHMKIGSYSILSAGANVLRDNEIFLICEQILVYETSMAKWLRENIADLSSEYLQRLPDQEANAER